MGDDARRLLELESLRDEARRLEEAAARLDFGEGGAELNRLRSVIDGLQGMVGWIWHQLYHPDHYEVIAQIEQQAPDIHQAAEAIHQRTLRTAMAQVTEDDIADVCEGVMRRADATDTAQAGAGPGLSNDNGDGNDGGEPACLAKVREALRRDSKPAMRAALRAVIDEFGGGE